MKSIFNPKAIFLLSLVFISICSFSQNNGEKDVRDFNQPKLQWWQEARFGMFIHWGPVTLTGKEIGWSRPSTGNTKYDSLYLRFNPKNFDAKEWVRTAQNAGMKYMVFTAKHMDGFCNWDTKTTDYNIMNSPFKRDICKELADAAHAAKMPICWYFITPDWKDTDCRNQKTPGVFEQRILAQLTELLTNYGKISLLWTDYDGFAPPTAASKVYELANRLQPGIIINNRLDVLHTDESHSFIGPYGDYATPEGFVAGYGAIPWETCTNLGHQWAWKFNDKPRPIKEAASTLLRCAGGNGNLLLNVGPDSLGVIPAEFEARLNEFGSWLKPISKSIYGTNGGPYSPSPNVVCTYKGKLVFVHVMKFTSDTITMPPLGAKVLSATVINGAAISFIQSKKWLKLIVPANMKTPIATTIELTINKSAGKLGIIAPFSTTGSLAYNKKITASSSAGQFLHDATAANDDNSSTAWVLGRRENIDVNKYFGTKSHYITSKDDIKAIFETSGWLEVDLGKAQTVGRVKLSERVLVKSKILNFEIQYKKGKQWVSWAKDTQMGVWEKELSPVKARYFRLVINERDYMSGIKEFQLFPPAK